MFIVHKSLTTSLPGVSTIQKWLEDSEGFSEAFADDIHQTFKMFVWLSDDEQCSKCFSLEREGKKLKVSPLEFVATVILIHKHKENMTLKQLSEAIGSMRCHIRSVEQDIRLNSRCIRVVMTFIINLEVSSLKDDPSNPLATLAIKKVCKPRQQLSEDLYDEVNTRPEKNNASKRKRESSDDEWQPLKATFSQQICAPQSPTKKSPRNSPNIDYRTLPERSGSHAASAPSPRTLSAQLSIPILAPQTFPSPSSSSEPRKNTDRLAALRKAKVGISVSRYQPSPVSPPDNVTGPNEPPYQFPDSQCVHKHPDGHKPT